MAGIASLYGGQIFSLVCYPGLPALNSVSMAEANIMRRLAVGTTAHSLRSVKWLLLFWPLVFTQFASATCLDETFNSNENAVFRSYIAFYGRPADPGGLAYWSDRLEAAQGSLTEIIDAFGNSPEYQDRFASLTPEALITNLYQQVLGRAPDSDGLAWYLDLLVTGQSTLPRIALSILDGAINQDARVIGNRVQSAHHYIARMREQFATHLNPDAEALADILQTVGESDESLTSACAAFDQLIEAEIAEEDTALYPTDAVAVVMDASLVTQPFKDLLGVNRSPLFEGKTPGGFSTGETYNGSALLDAFGISEIRLHDAGVDLCEIFLGDELWDYSGSSPALASQCHSDSSNGRPHLLWRVKAGVNLDDPELYDFSSLDANLALLNQYGFRLYLRLGESFDGPNDTDTPDAWATVARNIYQHATGAFAPGAISQTPRFVEIHNEPDGMFWVGSNEDFYTLYRTTFDTLQQADSVSLPGVGGSGFVHQSSSTLSDSHSLTGGFIPAVGLSRLDFFSAHFYGSCDQASYSELIDWLDDIRSGLALNQADQLPLHVTEWNIGLGSRCGNAFFTQPRLQSFVAGALAVMQLDKYKIEAAHYYSGMPVMSLFSQENNQFFVNPAAWSFLAHSQLVGGNLVETRLCQNGICLDLDESVSDASSLLYRQGVVSMAVLQPNGELNGILVNDQDRDQKVVLQIRGRQLTGRQVAVHQPPEAGADIQRIPMIKEGNISVPQAESVQAALSEFAKETIKTLDWDKGAATVELTVPAYSFVSVRTCNVCGAGE